MTNPFDYVNSINVTKEDIMIEESSYSPYMVNRALSYFPDTVFYANEMNTNSHLDSRLQYDFLRTAVRKRKRFSKWFKAEADQDLQLVKEAYSLSTQKARQALSALSEADLDEIRNKLDKGGKR